MYRLQWPHVITMGNPNGETTYNPILILKVNMGLQESQEQMDNHGHPLQIKDVCMYKDFKFDLTELFGSTQHFMHTHLTNIKASFKISIWLRM